MRSRADRVRLERVLRAVALGAIVFALVRLLLASGAAGAPAVHAHAEGGLEALARDSLAALARSGTRVTWSGTVSALAATTEPVRDPSARTRILAVGDSGVQIADSLGLLDSLGAAGGSLTTGALSGAVRVASHSGGGARTTARIGAVPGRVMVLGRVGWEAKFTIAALEEAGWNVDARLRLADTVRVTQGAAGDGTPRTGTHAAVVVLDTALGALAAPIARFVREGGGLVLSGEGAAALPALAPARVGSEMEGERDAFERGEPRHALPFVPLTSLRGDGVALERRDEMLAVAARRVGAGRVVQAGFVESWRWRMQAERDGAAEHRAYWNQLLATAAAAPRSPERNAAAGRDDASDETTAAQGLAGLALDESPLASTFQRLGPASADAPSSSPAPPALPAWLGAAILLLLLGEWGSRRARGAA